MNSNEFHIGLTGIGIKNKTNSSNIENLAAILSNRINIRNRKVPLITGKYCDDDYDESEDED